jgi:putative flippase GtrA
MRLFLLIATLALAGCATTGANVTGNEVGVTVNNVWNRNVAFPKADEHCRKYGKVAKPTDSDGEYAFTFECVKPGT